MLHIIGRKKGQRILETVWLNAIPPINYEDYKKAIVVNYGGSFEDYSLFKIEESSEISQKIKKNVPWRALWSNGEIVGVSFAPPGEKVKPLNRFQILRLDN